VIAQLAYLRVLELEPGSEATPMLVLAHEPVPWPLLQLGLDSAVASARCCCCFFAAYQSPDSSSSILFLISQYNTCPSGMPKRLHFCRAVLSALTIL